MGGGEKRGAIKVQKYFSFFMVCQLTRLLHLFNINRVPVRGKKGGCGQKWGLEMVEGGRRAVKSNAPPVNKISFQE